MKKVESLQNSQGSGNKRRKTVTFRICMDLNDFFHGLNSKNIDGIHKQLSALKTSLYIVETKTVTPSVVLDAPPAEMMLLFLLLV